MVLSRLSLFGGLFNQISLNAPGCFARSRNKNRERYFPGVFGQKWSPGFMIGLARRKFPAQGRYLPRHRIPPDKKSSGRAKASWLTRTQIL